MRLSIIIVNWNSAEYLRTCLQQLSAHAGPSDYEVIVADNGPGDTAARMLRADFPSVRVLLTGENAGFARANNLAAAISRGSNLLFLNPDTEVQRGAVLTMLSRLEALPFAGAAGCRLLNSDGTVQTSCVQRFPTILNQVLGVEWLRLRTRRWPLWGIRPLFEEPPVETPVEAVSGACLMIRRDAFQEVGGFTESFFMYAEDIDLCYKVRRAGRQVYYIGSATVVHHGGGSSPDAPSNRIATIRQREAIRKFLFETRGPLYAGCYRLAMGATALLRLLALGLLRALRAGGQSKSAIEKWSAVLAWAMAPGGCAR